MSTPRLVPFRPTAANAAPLFQETFTDWQGSGNWTPSGGDCLVDGWAGADNISLFSQALAFWCADPEEPADARSTRLDRVPITGLPPNTYVVVTVDVAFYAQSFGAVGKFIGMYVGANKFAPNVASSETVTPNEGQVLGYGITNEDGELSIGFGAEGITVSYDINIVFDNLRVTTPAAELADIYYDAGVGYIAGNPFSVTTGGISFDPGEELEEYECPGKRAPVEGGFEFVRAAPVMRTRFLLTGEFQFEVYRPGGAWSDGELEGMRKYVLAALGTALSAGYLDHFVAIWPRARGDYIGVLFRKALCRKYDMGSRDKDEGGQSVEILGVIPTGEPLTTVPYEIFTLPADATEVP